MEHQVAHTGSVRLRRATSPHLEDRGNCQKLPEQEQNEQIAGKDGAERAAGVHQRGHDLQTIAHVKSVDTA